MNKRIAFISPLVTFAIMLVAYATALGSVQGQQPPIEYGLYEGAADAGPVISSPINGNDNCQSVVQGESGSYVGDLPRTDGGADEVGGGDMSAVGGGLQRRGFGQPDLFYNFYTEGYANRTNAQMYLSPHPIPPNVGHTFYTYQPFYPHEMLYPHKERFHRYYDNGRGMNRTRAVYSYPPVCEFVKNTYWNYLRLPR